MFRNLKDMAKKTFVYMKWSPIYIRFVLKHKYDFFTIYTHLTVSERLLLYKLALSLKNNSTIVEIGSYLGASSSFLGCAAKEKGHKVYCVDTWKNEGMSEGERDTFGEFCENTKSLREFIYILRGKSEDMAKTFNEPINLLFIDGDHSYKTVKTDVELWLPKIVPGGIIILHDYGWAEGVKRVVKEIVMSKINFHEKLPNMFWGRIS